MGFDILRRDPCIYPELRTINMQTSPTGLTDDTFALHGRYTFECRHADGLLAWSDAIDNLVVVVGKDLALDTFLAGSAYTVTGPFMGLISSASFTAVASGDTMASHTGWLEAGSANAPTYSGTRNTCVWSAASGSSKSLSAALTFNMTGSGTVEGAFLVYGSGAVNTIGSTLGVLLSGAVFTGGAKTVASGDTVNVSFTMSA